MPTRTGVRARCRAGATGCKLPGAIRRGGVGFKGDWLVCYRANLESRIASRVLWRIATQPYESEADVYNTVRALPWDQWFAPTLTIRVNVAAIKSPLRSLDFVTLKIKDGVCDKFRDTTGRRPQRGYGEA